MIIGNWTLNSDSNSISYGDLTLQLEPKLVDVLVYLAKKPGVVVSREQLMTDVWSGAIVTDHAVNRVIGKLRKALNHDSESEEYIVTVPKKGYQLKADVFTIEENLFSKTSIEKSGGVKKNQVLAGVFLLIFTLFILWSFNAFQVYSTKLVDRPQVSQKKQVFNHVLPFTSQRGQEFEAAYSPNGEFIAFNHTPVGADVSDTYVRNLTSGKTIQVTDSEADEIRPAWSPNGRQLIVLRLKEQQCQYVKITFDALTMAPDNEEVVLSCDASLVIGAASWDTNNDTFYYPRGISVSQPFSIYSYQISTGRQNKLTNPPKGSIGDYHAEMSPAGNELVFLRAVQDNQTEIHSFDLSSGKSRKLFHLPWLLDKVSWAKDNQHLLYADPNGKIIEYDISQQTRSVLWVNAEKVSSPVYSPIKDEIIFTSGSRFNSDIMTARMAHTDTKTHIKEIVPIVDSIGGDYHPQYANHSKQFAYFSTKNGLPQIWLRDSNGEEQQISQFKTRMTPSTLHWSNDDLRLLSSSGERIYSISVESGNLTYHTEEIINANLPTWSRDNRSIFFASNQEGNWQIWKVNASDPKSLVKLTQKGGFSSQLGRSGHYLYMNRFMENGIWRMNLDNLDVEKVMSEFPINSYYNWRLINDRIYYLSDEPENSGLFVYDLLKQSTILVPDIKPSSHRGFSISADQKDILWVKVSRAEINLKQLSMNPSD